MYKTYKAVKASFIGGLILMLLVAGCGGSSAPARPAQPAPSNAGSAPSSGAAQQPANPSAPAAPQVTGNEALQPVGERMIIRTADVSIAITDTLTAVDQIKAIAEGLKGYVASSNLYRSDELLRGTITVRVPASDFDTAMRKIKAAAVKVEGEKESSQDVGEEYTDLTARRRNLEATEQELLKLLADTRDRGGKADDVLAIYRELTNIRGQIEQIQGRMQYLERMVALATINVELIPAEIAQPIAGTGWAPLATVHEASRSLVRAMQGLVNLAIWVIILILPVMVVVLLPLVVLVWALRRWRRARARPAAGAAQ